MALGGELQSHSALLPLRSSWEVRIFLFCLDIYLCIYPSIFSYYYRYIDRKIDG